MLTLLRTWHEKREDEEGFTLIELMVVVLIIAILIAIAIPTFLGAQDRARDRGAQSDVRNAVTAAKTIATDNAGEFTAVTLTAMRTAEGALSYVAGAGTTATVGVEGGGTTSGPSADFMLFEKESASGTFFAMAVAKTGEVKYCSGNASQTAGFAGGVLTGCTGAKW